MGYAKKCDRCGKLYETYAVGGKHYLKQFGISEANGIRLEHRYDSVNRSGGTTLDLCPECMEQFLKFWNMEDGREWIPLTPEQMPSECVLACDKTGEVLIGWIHIDEPSSTEFATENEHEIMYNTIAWMPLPEPYKEAQHGTIN